MGFQAIIQATTRFSKGLRYTGVGAVGCARSEMWLPNGVSNLQKGERCVVSSRLGCFCLNRLRYGNMDYPFACVVRHFNGLRVCIIAYDIACQWFINLRSRILKDWPPDLVPPDDIIFIPVIGKFHEPAHKVKNHQQYSANLIKWMGMTDWELMERLWGTHNPLSNSTKPMGPGTRIDTLEAHFGAHNWEKYIGHGNTLWLRYKEAIKDRNRQQEAHIGFTRSISEESPASKALLERWEEVCRNWEDAPHPKSDVPNPFEVTEDGMYSVIVEGGSN